MNSMPKIMLALQNDRNCELIKSELAEDYSVVTASREKDFQKSFDLVIFDLPTFKSFREFCGERIEAEKPLFLPVLLLINRERKEVIGQYLGTMVDDILMSPVKKFELKMRIQSLLRTRRFSVKLKEQMEKKALRDPLTGLYNRRYFDDIIDQEAERARRYEHPIAFCMMDMNNFKAVNDRYSHMVGDEVLREIANLLQDNIRESDILIRYGGDEFLLVMPETDGESINVLKRIKTVLERWNKKADIIDLSLEIAVGHSHWFPNQDRDIKSALEEADKKMYEDKK